jgi:NAD(P)H-dependent FMN reductase
VRLLGRWAVFVVWHTKAWAANIDSFDAFVFVTPEYNHGISSDAFKNAIDFLYRKRNNKAAGFVATAARAVESLRRGDGRAANR